MKVAVSLTTFAEEDSYPLTLLQSNVNQVILNPFKRKPTECEMFELLKGVDGLLAGVENISRMVLEKAPQLKVISRCGTGIDNIDLKCAKERKIKIMRTPEAPAPAVAELTLALTLAALRKVNSMDRKMRERQWITPMGYLLEGKTYGILGLGHVGKRLVELLTPFRCNILAYDVVKDCNFLDFHKIKYLSFDEVMSQSDIVSIHCPLLPETNRIIDWKKLSLMKSGSILINTARSQIIVEEDLITALNKGPLSLACLDVFDEEPYSGPLINMDNTVLTCHIGSYTKETRRRMETEAVENLLRGLDISL